MLLSLLSKLSLFSASQLLGSAGGFNFGTNIPVLDALVINSPFVSTIAP